ncbi:hypothetical protein PTSG_03569 [Salpingoeca rosetta]|uniref:Uncharacterized protein n=1 Tax=Salpingoeca rosetta (strain ATCC 50818 / BSB-021) TaxID=946362 RepID=F2U5Z5_SALR5|nr:uncharacterized protein PTSG_03569 [Salpingoeca rosetta]EGD82936.1 hypothetical protein PTSG_03569 [Salpingoeca rosetta]|eukprot:XP_004995300.1 hypothetical protein PTSG_03569 [Salpingoeca rosetta]
MDGTGSAAVAERGQQGRAVPAEAAKEEDVVVQSSVFRFFGELSLDSSDGGGVDGDASSAARSGDDAQDDDHARHLRDGVIALLQTLSTTFDQGAITPATWHQLAQGLVDECKARLRGDYLEAPALIVIVSSSLMWCSFVWLVGRSLAQHVPTEAVAGEPCHNTAIVICPPSELHACIQAIRSQGPRSPASGSYELLRNLSSTVNQTPPEPPAKDHLEE